MDTSIPIPAKGILVGIVSILFIVKVLHSGWKGNLLVYLAVFILFNIFFDIVPYSSESFTDINVDNTQVVNCSKYKEAAIDNIEDYINCKNDTKSNVSCPNNLVNTKSISEQAEADGAQIQDEKYYANKQPVGDRVCGLIPGHQQQTENSTTESSSSIKLLTDDELKKAINADIKLHKLLSKTKDGLLQDSLNPELHKRLDNIQSVIKQIKPMLIYNLRAQNKDRNYVKNAINDTSKV